MGLNHGQAPAYNYDMGNAGTPTAVGHWHSITCWQWGDNGRLDGWEGPLDMDVFYGERELWERLEKNEPVPVRKSDEEIADEVIAGKWGNGAEREQRLKEAGSDPASIQQIVNEKKRRTSEDELDEEVRTG